LFDLNYEYCGSVEFVDDYRLLVEPTTNIPQSLVLMDTRYCRRRSLIQTFFQLPYFLGGLVLILEQGAHKPSPEESLAPFHQDPTQRIVAFATDYPLGYFVVRLGTFLELPKDSEGSKIGWEKWKHHIFIPSISLDRVIRRVRVSGCRLFLLSSTHYTSSDFQMEVYDFSMQGRPKHSTKQTSEGSEEFRVMTHLSSTGASSNSWDIFPDDTAVFFHWTSSW